jgi:hypothetical protein
MITAIVRFQLRPGISREQALEEIRHTIPIYQKQAALIRKQISLDLERSQGMSVYLWKDRAAAEAFYEMARPILKQQTGHDPEITLHETQVLVEIALGVDIIVSDAGRHVGRAWYARQGLDVVTSLGARPSLSAGVGSVILAAQHPSHRRGSTAAYPRTSCFRPHRRLTGTRPLLPEPGRPATG